MRPARRRTPPRLAAAAVIATVLIAAAIALAAISGDGRAGASLSATATGGSFAHANSRDGLPIFSTAGIAPGDSATGSVTLANTGSLAGRFTLSATDVDDVPGQGGGSLSQRLRLELTDVTAADRPVALYEGGLAAMTTRDLGIFQAGEARTYRFVATLPDGGAPAGSGAGDNDLQGAATSVRYVWHAVEEAPAPSPTPGPEPTPTPEPSPAPSPAPPTQPPPGPNPASPPPSPTEERAREGTRGDTRQPRLRLAVPRVQRIFRSRRIVMRARCGEPCRVMVRGRVRVGGSRLRLAPARAHAGARKAVRLALRFPRRHRRAMRRALSRGRTVTVRIALAARDRDGNRTVVRRTLHLRAR